MKKIVTLALVLMLSFVTVSSGGADSAQKTDDELLNTGSAALEIADQYDKQMARLSYISSLDPDKDIMYAMYSGDDWIVGENMMGQEGIYRLLYMGSGSASLEISCGDPADPDYLNNTYEWSTEDNTNYDEFDVPLSEGCRLVCKTSMADEFDALWLVKIGELDSAEDGSATPALSTQSEILFRDIPWFVSITDAKLMLHDKCDLPEGRLRGDETMYSWGPDYTAVSAPNGGFEYSLIDLGNNLFVGGHSVQQMLLYALYGHSEDEIFRDETSSRFYQAKYFFDDADEDTYSDLLEKLNSLYGEPVEKFKSDDGEETYAIWHGANNTGSILRLNIYSVRSSILSLTYGQTNTDSLIEDLNAAFARINSKSSGETDGL